MTNDETELLIRNLKRSYFVLIVQENIPHTPKVTQELDRLEKWIGSLKSKLKR